MPHAGPGRPFFHSIKTNACLATCPAKRVGRVEIPRKFQQMKTFTSLNESDHTKVGIYSRQSIDKLHLEGVPTIQIFMGMTHWNSRFRHNPKVEMSVRRKEAGTSTDKLTTIPTVYTWSLFA